MYFIGYSKWLLLSSRLVAGENGQTLVNVHYKQDSVDELNHHLS